MSNDIIYVVYFDGEMYGGSQRKRKSTYTKISGAKQIVTEDSKYIAEKMYEYETGLHWYGLGEEQREEWLNKARQRFQIKEFIEKVK